MDFPPQGGLVLLAFDRTALWSSFWLLNIASVSDWMLAETYEFY